MLLMNVSVPFTALLDFVRYKRFKFFNRNPLLLRRVAVSNRHILFLEGVEVNSDAKWRSYFILRKIALAYVASVVPGNVEMLSQVVIDFLCFCNEFGFIGKKRKYGGFIRGEGRGGVEVHPLFFSVPFLAIRLKK